MLVIHYIGIPGVCIHRDVVQNEVNEILKAHIFASDSLMVRQLAVTHTNVNKEASTVYKDAMAALHIKCT